MRRRHFFLHSIYVLASRLLTLPRFEPNQTKPNQTKPNQTKKSVDEMDGWMDGWIRIENNIKINAFLERHVPANWRRPPPDAAPSVRARWIEAKYVRRLFVLPDYTGEYACPQDLLSAAQGKNLVVGEGGVLLDGTRPIGAGGGGGGGGGPMSSFSQALNSISHVTGVDRVLPTRLVDYFVTCGAPLADPAPKNLFLEGAQSSGSGGAEEGTHLKASGGGSSSSSRREREAASSFARKMPDAEQLALALSGLAAVRFRPVVLDSYPSKDDAPHADCLLPDHIARFAFPEGFGLGVTCVSALPGFFGYGGSGDDDVVDMSVDGVNGFAAAGRSSSPCRRARHARASPAHHSRHSLPCTVRSRAPCGRRSPRT